MNDLKITAHDDLKMMKTPNNWPGMVLPIKKSFGEIGILLGDKPTVYLVNMWDIPKDLKTAPQKKYATYEEIVADGWKVD